MGKSIRRFGVGLALGALAAHYLQTEKGQVLLEKVKKGLAAYQEDPAAYQEEARAFFQDKLSQVKDLVQEDGEWPVEPRSTQAEVDDIIITYTEEDLR